LKAVAMIMVTAIAFFWSFMHNPAIGRCVPGAAAWALRPRGRASGAGFKARAGRCAPDAAKALLQHIVH
jgi:hypothetical protein